MLEKYKAILWDVDGTLIDTKLLHAEGTKYAMKKLGFEFTEEDIKRYISLEGLRFFEIMKILRPELDMDTLRTLRAIKNEYVTRHIDKAPLKVPPSFIKELGKTQRQGIVSSSTRNVVNAVLERMGVKNLMEVIITAEDVEHGKPNPEGLLKAMEKLGERDVVYIGDTEYDREASKRAGIDFIHIDELVKLWR